eukprot:scaffold1893_cov220-Amphora_coffeaeformis.AAC.26
MVLGFAASNKILSLPFRANAFRRRQQGRTRGRSKASEKCMVSHSHGLTGFWHFSKIANFREKKVSIYPTVWIARRHTMNSDLTVDSELVSTLHDRQRRQQRAMEKEDLQRARRYGMMEDGRRPGVKKYHHAGRVLVYDEWNNTIITSYGVPSGRKRSGTQKYTPVLLKKSAEHDNKEAEKNQNRVRDQILMQRENWKSHTVLVVDHSGSMRQDDVNGARCRSDGVWMVLARDFVKKKLEERSVSVTDVVSIILMKDTAEVICRYQPITWVLYNYLVDLREWTTEKPTGGGCYLPALEKAKEVLSFNSKCPVLGLIFFSDGKPSDSPSEQAKITSTMGSIASQFGRRLVVTFIGMADKRKEEFSIMKEMTSEAKDFGCPSDFNAPDLSTSSLSSIVNSSSSSMTSTRTELTDLRTGKLRIVRTDVLREKQGTPDDLHANDQWNVFMASSDTRYTQEIFVWNNRMEDFATLVDPRCYTCYKVVLGPQMDGNIGAAEGLLCPRCKACYVCFDCLNQTRNWSGAHDWLKVEHGCSEAARLRRNGLVVHKSLPSFNVAYKKTAFGEGAERLAFKFRFVANDGKTFIGPKMVAKESRFIETKDSIDDQVGYLLSDRFSYHKQFMRTQAIASKFARIYNNALDDLPENFWTKQYPRVRFLDPMVIEIEDRTCGVTQTRNILVEPMIEGTYRKFNSNNGKIAAVAESAIAHGEDTNTGGIPKRIIDSLLRRGALARSSSTSVSNAVIAEPTKTQGADVGLGIIEEGSEDEGSDSGSEHEDIGAIHARTTIVRQKTSTTLLDELVADDVDFVPSTKKSYGKIRDEDFAQAFSHYSYVRSGGQLMVVDLQGTLHVKPDQTREFIFTDPAIHKRKRAMGSEYLRALNLGRTNRGRQGMEDFWESHVCSDACRVLGLRPRPKYGEGVGQAPPAQKTEVG